jgi:hypothetical protein
MTDCRSAEIAAICLSGSALPTLAILPTCGGRRRAKGEKASPLAIPGLWFLPTAGKAPSCGILSTGWEPHAIPGVTLPLPVILTAHRLHSPHHSARQTASGCGEKGQSSSTGGGTGHGECISLRRDTWITKTHQIHTKPFPRYNDCVSVCALMKTSCCW